MKCPLPSRVQLVGKSSFEGISAANERLLALSTMVHVWDARISLQGLCVHCSPTDKIQPLPCGLQQHCCSPVEPTASPCPGRSTASRQRERGSKTFRSGGRRRPPWTPARARGCRRAARSRRDPRPAERRGSSRSSGSLGPNSPTRCQGEGVWFSADGQQEGGYEGEVVEVFCGRAI